MAIRKVARMGHPVLRQPTRELSREEIRAPETRALVRDMIETMHEYGGVGLAAPQVHEPVRLAVLEVDAESARYPADDEQPLLVVFNAHVTVLDETPFGFWEGCLSVPGLRGYVERPSRIRVDYQDHEGEQRALEAQGFIATVFQHELDHLDGVLYVDKVKDPSRLAFIEEYQRYHMEAPQPDPED
ncbi:MAG: peptide deformylase [Myxococcales bacterium]|nr:peptide deformylase [Myxococcales bacterium]